MNEDEVLDWSILPTRLAFLAKPAEKYGKFQFDNIICAYLSEKMMPGEDGELQLLAQQLELHSDDIEKFLDQYNMTAYPEARLVYFAGYLVNIARDLGIVK